MQVEELTLDQLRTFIAVAEEGSFSAAGRKLRRVQSAVSYAIHNLEAVLGVALFDRSHRQAKLTSQGQALLTEVHSVRTQLEQLSACAQSLREGLEGEVSVVLDAIYPIAKLAEVSRHFYEKFPNVNLRVHTEVLGAVGHVIADGVAQIGMSGPDGLYGFSLKREAVAEIELLPVVTPHHPLARYKRFVPIDALREHVQIVLSDRSSATRGVDYGVLSRRPWRVADFATKLALLKEGLGWGSMPRHMIGGELARADLVIINSRAWRPHQWLLSLYATYSPARPPGPAGRWMLSALSAAVSHQAQRKTVLSKTRQRV